MPDELTFEILEDGRAVLKTDAVSMPNHLNAENIIKTIGQLTGAPVQRRARTDVKKAGHKHEHKAKS